MTPPAARDEVAGVGEEAVGARALPLRVARREMGADVAGADRPEQCVGQRVEPDVGVAVADQAVAMRHADAAQPQVVAGAEAVDVEAECRARNHGAR